MNTIFDRKLRREYVAFREPPVITEELALVELVKKFFLGLNTCDIELVISLFSEDAQIMSLGRSERVDVTEYRRALKDALPRLTFTGFDDVFLRMNKKSGCALISGTLTTLFLNLNHQGGFSMECAKKDGLWKITSTNRWEIV